MIDLNRSAAKGSAFTRTALIAALIAASALTSACMIRLPRSRAIPLDSFSGAPERTPKFDHAGFTIARATLHNHTTYSDGHRAPEDLLELARRQGIAVIAYNDHREGKFCLGTHRLFCVDTGQVSSVGYDNYFEHLARIQEQAAAQDMIALRGIEVSSPYMFNDGWFPNLVIRGQFNHFTVYGIQDPQVFEGMPVKDYLRLRPEGEAGLEPYQRFVDYITEQGGIVHAVHVESNQDEWLGGIHVLTPPPVWNLTLRHLTGFSILPEGWHDRAGGPGGLWDSVLIQYLAGMRERPLWASGDADYHGPHGSLVNATTLFYLREFTEAEVFNCMREGRMVALEGEAFQDVYVAEWSVSAGGAPRAPIMLGERVKAGGAVTVRFALSRPVDGCVTRLIKNGVVIREVEGTELGFVDREAAGKNQPAYYRVEVLGPGADQEADYDAETMPTSVLFVNPIFVVP